MSTASTPSIKEGESDSGHSHGRNASPLPDKEAQISTPAAPSGPPPATVLTAAAWLTVLGGFACSFAGFGFLNAFGVLQLHYQQTVLPTTSASALSWIGSVQVSFLFGANIVTGVLLDRYGPKIILLFVTLLYPLSCIFVSLCDEYWQFLLAEGFLQGIALSGSFMPPIACAIQHFREKKGIAIAIIVSGSSLGGVLWPIIVRALLAQVGLGWTWRVIALLSFILFGTGCLAVTSPLLTDLRFVRRLGYSIKTPASESAAPGVGELEKSPSATTANAATVAKPQQPLFYLELLRDPIYIIAMASMALMYFQFFFTFFYLPSWGAMHGMSQGMQFYSASILNAASFFGRLGFPLLGPRLGNFAVFGFCLGVAGIIALAGIAVTSPAGVLVNGGAYGFISGGAISIYSACIATVTPDLRRLGASTAQFAMAVAIPALLGPPVDGWVVVSKAGFKGAQALSGAVCLFAAFCALCAHVMLVRRDRAKKAAS